MDRQRRKVKETSPRPPSLTPPSPGPPCMEKWNERVCRRHWRKFLMSGLDRLLHVDRARCSIWCSMMWMPRNSPSQDAIVVRSASHFCWSSYIYALCSLACPMKFECEKIEMLRSYLLNTPSLASKICSINGGRDAVNLIWFDQRKPRCGRPI